MADRTLKGSRIGSTSLQGEHGVELAPRKQVTYVTHEGKHFSVTFEIDAEEPPEWFDPRTGDIGFLEDDAGRAAQAEFDQRDEQQRTHWDMLLERRTREELEALLAERLQLLRERRGSADHDTAD